MSLLKHTLIVSIYGYIYTLLTTNVVNDTKNETIYNFIYMKCIQNKYI